MISREDICKMSINEIWTRFEEYEQKISYYKTALANANKRIEEGKA